VAAKLDVPVVHLEAGLRSGDRSMPEEINRIVADHLADLLLTTCADGDNNLLREGVEQERIVNIGNTMIDSLWRLRAKAEETVVPTRRRLGLGGGPIALVTLHRPSNVDEPERLVGLLDLLHDISSRVPVVFPVHLRTRSRISDLATDAGTGDCPLHLIDPLGYLEFIGLMTQAAVVITDSGGVQEETTFLGVPCVTVRTTTERPVTVTLGTNRLADPDDADAIHRAVEEALAAGPAVPPPVVPLWDGQAGKRAVETLVRWKAKRTRGARA